MIIYVSVPARLQELVQDLPPLSLFLLLNMFMRILDWWTNTGFLSLADPPTGLAASGQPGERLAPATCRHQENELRYPPNIFDLVILRETLMYLDREDKAVILRKIKQLLRRPMWLARWFIWNGALPLDLVGYQRVRVWQIIGRRLNPPMLFE